MKEKISKIIKKMKINEKMINYLLILILGVLVGVAVKTEAKKRVTIGYSDYLAQNMKQAFDLSKPNQNQGPQNQAEPEGSSDEQLEQNASDNQ